ncbi:hypothetical protein BKA69DRAFT_1122615 [Paraphysoderma sedebokerense]|nr:hypothetical protein BKA69DRAFT_1122615 [Paraphysoderma sedebokerense]
MKSTISLSSLASKFHSQSSKLKYLHQLISPFIVMPKRKTSPSTASANRKRSKSTTINKTRITSNPLPNGASSKLPKQTYVAFLRALNVGGSGITKMDDLKNIFTSLGFTNVSTFIASGNVVFDVGEEYTNEVSDLEALDIKRQQLSERIQKELFTTRNLKTEVFLRTFDELNSILSYVERHSKSQPQVVATFLVGFLLDALPTKQTSVIDSFQSDIDTVLLDERDGSNGKELYWFCRKKQSESKLNGNIMEKTLKTPITFRNVNTIRRIVDKFGK